VVAIVVMIGLMRVPVPLMFVMRMLMTGVIAMCMLYSRQICCGPLLLRNFRWGLARHASKDKAPRRHYK
jgi:hypothetical protein